MVSWGAAAALRLHRRRLCFLTIFSDETGGLEEGDGEGQWPPWLKPLLSAQFFKQCKHHADSHKSECNMFCLDCVNGALCSVCLAFHHRDHRTIQIRRSSYHDVIRVSELQKVLDIGGRPQPRPGKGVTNTCEVCDRSLLDSFRFCSLGCKFIPSLTILIILPDCGDLEELPEARQEQETAAAAAAGGGSDSEESSITAKSDKSTTQSFTPSTPPATCVNYRTNKRRKGIPHRAPLGSLIAEYY
ncbi:unnamed protein product [Spirodela intermedia]|uniref:Uncharacterized protein n=1 Tax=Spirodela intermedia TaxID=51605 RepID=A0A7I8JHP3_SPIIN|nr:unnamed protein product [Spirodela intermedia]CAA6669667.1 unnamed protein product [Spirodela intermedia]